MQTILGAGGSIGKPLAKELKKYTDHIRLVSRNPQKVNDTDELFPIDLSDFNQVDKAIEGSDVVYVVVGFEYKLSVWEKTWPPFMEAVIKSCIKHNAKLVFFDNVYMYTRSAISLMTENSKHNPHSKKGQVRMQLHDMIMDEVHRGNLTALIARSADFYGPDCKTSALSIMVGENLAKGKSAQSFGDIDKVHTYTYTPDAAMATALLGNTLDAYNQVWHLPTTNKTLSNREWMQLLADEAGVKLKVKNISTGMMRFLGIFMPIMREFPEMMYQYERDYFFDSGKFERRFGIIATEPEVGVKVMMDQIKSDLAKK